MRIGVDLDGVVYDFVGSLRDWLIRERNYSSAQLGPATQWDFYKDWGMSLNQWKGLIDVGVNAGAVFADGPPVPYAITALTRLKEAGHSIHIASNRGFGSRSLGNTESWLQKNSVPYDTISFTADKSLINVDIFIDDYAVNCEQIKLAGGRPVLFRQPWNKDYADVGWCESVYDWKEFEDLIMSESHMRLIGLSGYAQTGKDTTADILYRNGYERASFADNIRDALYALNPIIHAGVRLQHMVDGVGWEEARRIYPEIRKLQQRMGTDAGRRILGENIWIDTTFKKFTPGTSYVFSDVRFPNEANAIRKAGGEVWRIERPGYGPINDHESETALDDYDFDRVITNDASEAELFNVVSEILKPALV